MDSNLDPQTVTLLLARLRPEHAEADRAEAREQLFHLLYADLRRLAAHYMQAERANHTLQPTALVHEAYLRLFGDHPGPIQDRRHFMALAGQVMRRLLVDHARKRRSEKRGAGVTPIDIDQAFLYDDADPDQFLAIDQALVRLESLDPRQCRIVEMRFFAGLTEGEIADALGISERTVKRDWRVARAWLHGELAAGSA